jgi:NADH pyrophosphatase NudC (nudix superfamily)
MAAWNATCQRGSDFKCYTKSVPQPKFIPKPGQVDYTNIRYAPVVNIVVTFKGKIYCVKRSPDMRLYPNYWDWVCGFLDDDKSIEEKAYEELSEELDIKPTDIESLTRGAPWIDEAPGYKKTWLIVPVLAKVKTDQFTLDWEATEGKWFKLEELKELGMVPGSLKTIKSFLEEP